MKKARLEAFSDGVFAILITILVLELHTPAAPTLAALRVALPSFLGYVLSFVFIGIYWNNHHHLLTVAERVDGRVLWANLFLLFWLSLIPFVTDWLGTTSFASLPVAAYGVVLFSCGFAYFALTRALFAVHGADTTLVRALRDDRKERASLVFYLAAIALAWRWPLASCALYVVVAILWLVPDRRIERTLAG